MERVLENAKQTKKLKTEETKAPENNEDDQDFSWVSEDIIVKIKDESLKKYHNQKGKIIRVVEPFIAEVEMLNGGSKLQIDQEFLETVIPVRIETV